MDSIDPADTRAAAFRQLAEIQEDPLIQHLALRHAGHPALADDGLQRAYYAVARLENLEQIQNLRAYFCKVLIREIRREHGQLGAALVDDFAHVAETCQGTAGCQPASPLAVEDVVCASLQAQAWLERFAAHRHRLRAEVSGRSGDPALYRAVVCDAAGQVLRDAINGEPSQADTNPALRAAYPEYFAQPDVPANTLHQRFLRARADVKALLQAVVNRDELT